ncbi:MAG: zinc ribbon domain-containing protein [Ruminococcus sp.]|nr:zinc ribbon domain-containing protein [Ruminococcus sp.]
MICPNCGKNIYPGTTACPVCGTAVNNGSTTQKPPKPQPQMHTSSRTAAGGFCSKCGAAINSNETFCRSCGEPVISSSGSTTNRAPIKVFDALKKNSTYIFILLALNLFSIFAVFFNTISIDSTPRYYDSKGYNLSTDISSWKAMDGIWEASKHYDDVPDPVTIRGITIKTKPEYSTTLARIVMVLEYCLAITAAVFTAMTIYELYKSVGTKTRNNQKIQKLLVSSSIAVIAQLLIMIYIKSVFAIAANESKQLVYSFNAWYYLLWIACAGIIATVAFVNKASSANGNNQY